MSYVKCNKCTNMVHYKPVNVLEFEKRHNEDGEPIYCYGCFKKMSPKERNAVLLRKEDK